jgi:DNA-binding PadR family transcriptional regulator
MSAMPMDDDNPDAEGRHQGPWGNPGPRHREHLGRMLFGRRGFLRPQIIQLLEKQPMNGVDIMNELQGMSHGWYRPSPGSIYPLLEHLEKEGLIAKNKDGKFELTAAYREQMGVGDDLVSALSVMESNTSYLEDLQKSDGRSLSKYRDRIEKLKKRLEALNDAPQSERGP